MTSRLYQYSPFGVQKVKFSCRLLNLKLMETMYHVQLGEPRAPLQRVPELLYCWYGFVHLVDHLVQWTAVQVGPDLHSLPGPLLLVLVPRLGYDY